MADVVVIGSARCKRRNPWGTFLLSLITLGIYYLVWYYKINREMRDYGVENSPGVALLAVTFGVVLIVPPYVSYYKTADRILKSQVRSGTSERIVPVVGLLLLIFFGVFALPYYQSQLNKAWDAEVGKGAATEPS